MAESNEELARMAQALAEKCFVAGDIVGAKRWAQSAHKLAPGLPGVAQAAAVYDVHSAAARGPIGVGGAPDWYKVLGLPPPHSGVITHDAIKQQHRKLCLLVHPDKNPSAAADGAFKLVQAAWEALSARHPSVTAPSAARPPREEELFRYKPGKAAAKKPPDPPPRQAAPPTPEQPHVPRWAQVVQMPRNEPRPAAAPSREKREPQRQKMEPPPTSGRPPSPARGKCPHCGARTPTNSARSSRCMSCHWSPMDSRPWVPDDEDYY